MKSRKKKKKGREKKKKGPESAFSLGGRSTGRAVRSWQEGRGERKGGNPQPTLTLFLSPRGKIRRQLKEKRKGGGRRGGSKPLLLHNSLLLHAVWLYKRAKEEKERGTSIETVLILPSSFWKKRIPHPRSGRENKKKRKGERGGSISYSFTTLYPEAMPSRPAKTHKKKKKREEKGGTRRLGLIPRSGNERVVDRGD